MGWGKRVFVSLLRALQDKLVPPVAPQPDWKRRGASVSVNGLDISDPKVATVVRSRDRLRGKDEAGGG